MRTYNAKKAARNLLARATWRRAYVYEEDTAVAEESIAKVLRKAYNAGRKDGSKSTVACFYSAARAEPSRRL